MSRRNTSCKCRQEIGLFLPRRIPLHTLNRETWENIHGGSHCSGTWYRHCTTSRIVEYFAYVNQLVKSSSWMRFHHPPSDITISPPSSRVSKGTSSAILAPVKVPKSINHFLSIEINCAPRILHCALLLELVALDLYAFSVLWIGVVSTYPRSCRVACNGFEHTVYTCTSVPIHPMLLHALPQALSYSIACLQLPWGTLQEGSTPVCGLLLWRCRDVMTWVSSHLRIAPLGMSLTAIDTANWLDVSNDLGYQIEPKITTYFEPNTHGWAELWCILNIERFPIVGVEIGCHAPRRWPGIFRFSDALACLLGWFIHLMVERRFGCFETPENTMTVRRNPVAQYLAHGEPHRPTPNPGGTKREETKDAWHSHQINWYHLPLAKGENLD